MKVRKNSNKVKKPLSVQVHVMLNGEHVNNQSGELIRKISLVDIEIVFFLMIPYP